MMSSAVMHYVAICRILRICCNIKQRLPPVVIISLPAMKNISRKKQFLS